LLFSSGKISVKKTYVYVDAFNLYFGAVRGTPYKWLDLHALCKRLLPKNDVVCIKYFTAKVQPRPGDPGQPTRQETYLRALRTIPNLEIHYGHFLSNTTLMPLADPQPGQPATVKVIKTEEKGSDVNLACQLLHDAYKDRFECAVVISGDSDLKMPIEMVINEFQKPVGVVNPHKNPSRQLQKIATFYKQIRQSVLLKCQFPDQLIDDKGTFSCPERWKATPPKSA